MDLIVRRARRRHHADLVVVDAPSVQEACRTQPLRLAVIHDGRLVAERGRIIAG